MDRALLGLCWLGGLAHANAGSLAPPAPAESASPVECARPPCAPRPQLQLDLGLSVLGAGYEHPVASHVAIGVEAFVFGTYFLPWFDAGDAVAGVGAGLRPTWFPRTNGRGLYVAPYLRIATVGDELTSATGTAVSAGVFVGWVFGLSPRLELRVGGGAQYLHVDAEGETEALTASTPFVALDAVLGYRL